MSLVERQIDILSVMAVTAGPQQHSLRRANDDLARLERGLEQHVIDPPAGRVTARFVHPDADKQLESIEIDVLAGQNDQK
jgi:hypothetical protein